MDTAESAGVWRAFGVAVARDAAAARAAAAEPRLLLFDADTFHAAARVRTPSGQLVVSCSADAPAWMRAAAAAAAAGDTRGGCARPRPAPARFRTAGAGDPPYAAQLAALVAGAAAHVALAGAGAPAPTVRLPLRAANGCFAHAAMHALARVSHPDLWTAPAARAERASDLPPGLEEMAKQHVRDALHAFAASGDARLVAVVKHLVGAVLVRATDKAANLDDGRQHDSCEFLLRLLTNALDAAPQEVASTDSTCLRWAVPRGNFAFAELGGGAPDAPGDATAVVAHAGSATSGHYTAYVRVPGGGGWRAVGEAGAGEPRGVKIAFFSRGLAPMFM